MNNSICLVVVIFLTIICLASKISYHALKHDLNHQKKFGQY